MINKSQNNFTTGVTGNTEAPRTDWLTAGSPVISVTPVVKLFPEA